jgi:hypothetical protein
VGGFIMSNKYINALAVAFVFSFIPSSPLLAHHGNAAFDMEKLTTIKGTVTKFLFINPHTLIFVDVKNADGAIEHWIAEESSGNHLSRVGWNRDTLKVGGEVTIAGHRAKNAAYSLELQCGECSVADSHGNAGLQQ